MTRYRAEYFENGEWRVEGTFDTMTEAELHSIRELGGYNYTRVVPVEEPK